MIYRVFWDPGHGPDDGCVSADGSLFEHEYVYDVSLRANEHAMMNMDWHSSISRSENEDPTQQERDKKARDDGADTIISLHCDSAGDKSWHGATVFYYATNYKTKMIAYEIAHAMPEPLWQNGSKRARIISIPDTRYPDATAVVSRYTPPTVLVEFGFLSNADDVAYLRRPYMKERIACALLAGACIGAGIYGT